MLQEILIANVASYPQVSQKLSDLKAVNYIFGTNGSGKTTISRVIADPESRPSCSLKWVKDQLIERLVYNSDFITKNYSAKISL